MGRSVGSLIGSMPMVDFPGEKRGGDWVGC